MSNQPSMSGSSGAAGMSGAGSLQDVLAKLPALINSIGSIYVQTRVGKSIRSAGRFQQRQLDLQSRMLELQVRERARELRKQADRNSATAQSIFAQRGVLPGVGSAYQMSIQPLQQAGEDIETIRTNQAFTNIGLQAERGAIGVRTRLKGLNNYLNMQQSASSLFESM